MLSGNHLIAGDWVAGEATFASEPAHGEAHDFSVGTPAHVLVEGNRVEGGILPHESHRRQGGRRGQCRRMALDRTERVARNRHLKHFSRWGN